MMCALPFQLAELLLLLESELDCFITASWIPHFMMCPLARPQLDDEHLCHKFAQCRTSKTVYSEKLPHESSVSSFFYAQDRVQGLSGSLLGVIKHDLIHTQQKQVSLEYWKNSVIGLKSYEIGIFVFIIVSEKLNVYNHMLIPLWDRDTYLNYLIFVHKSPNQRQISHIILWPEHAVDNCPTGFALFMEMLSNYRTKD